MAKEKRLIDADAFESEIRKMFRPYGDGTYPGDYAAMIHDETLVDVLGTINEAQTVDAVEVVRCEFCEHWDKGYRFCKRHGLDYYGNSSFGENGFCSYGVRRK